MTINLTFAFILQILYATKSYPKKKKQSILVAVQEIIILVGINFT